MGTCQFSDARAVQILYKLCCTWPAGRLHKKMAPGSVSSGVQAAHVTPPFQRQALLLMLTPTLMKAEILGLS